MKKQTLFILFSFTTLFTILFFSCSKDNVEELSDDSLIINPSASSEILISEKQSTNQENIFVENGYLVFPSKSVFNEFINQNRALQTDVSTLESTYGYRSYLNHIKDDDENKDLRSVTYFIGLLNEQAAVAIGDYVFKQNHKDRQTFIIKRTSSIEDIQYMINATHKDYLPKSAFALSYEQDVFHLIKHPDELRIALSSNESMNVENGINPIYIDKDESVKNYNCEYTCFNRQGNYTTISGTSNAKATAQYLQLGIYYQLSANFKHWAKNEYFTVCASNANSIYVPVHFDFIYQGCYQIKRESDKQSFHKGWNCSTPPPAYSSYCYPFYSGDKTFGPFYSGTEPLFNYWLKAAARAKGLCDQHQNVWTGWAEIGIESCRTPD